MTIEDRLKQVRKKAGYSQKELADIIGITARTVQRYEKDASSLTVNIATNISHLCKVDLTWLITGNQCESESTNLTKIIIEHQNLAKRFKNPQRAKEITERLINIEEVGEELFDKAYAYIQGLNDAAEVIKASKENSNKDQDLQNRKSTA